MSSTKVKKIDSVAVTAEAETAKRTELEQARTVRAEAVATLQQGHVKAQAGEVVPLSALRDAVESAEALVQRLEKEHGETVQAVLVAEAAVKCEQFQKHRSTMKPLIFDEGDNTTQINEKVSAFQASANKHNILLLQASKAALAAGLTPGKVDPNAPIQAREDGHGRIILTLDGVDVAPIDVEKESKGQSIPALAAIAETMGQKVPPEWTAFIHKVKTRKQRQASNVNNVDDTTRDAVGWFVGERFGEALQVSVDWLDTARAGLPEGNTVPCLVFRPGVSVSWDADGRSLHGILKGAVYLPEGSTHEDVTKLVEPLGTWGSYRKDRRGPFAIPTGKTREVVADTVQRQKFGTWTTEHIYRQEPIPFKAEVEWTKPLDLDGHTVVGVTVRFSELALGTKWLEEITALI